MSAKKSLLKMMFDCVINTPLKAVFPLIWQKSTKCSTYISVCLNGLNLTAFKN